MRGFFLLTIAAVVLFATTSAENAETRSLRVIADDTEERAGLSSLKNLKSKVKTFKAKVEEVWDDGTILYMIQRGDDQDTILAKMGVKPSFIDEKGTKFYGPKDPGWQKYSALLQYTRKGV